MKPQKLAFCIPVYNDWNSFLILAKKIDDELCEEDIIVTIFAVDDCSIKKYDSFLLKQEIANFKIIQHVKIIHLTTNLGHQRAIAIGLCVIYDQHNFDNILVADADGEDRPKDMHTLIKKAVFNDQSIIVGQRQKRSESFIFQFFYYFYKIFFKICTGKLINFGNFSLIPSQVLIQLINRQELWNHYAATIIRSKIPIKYVSTERGKRYFGQSSMNFVSLIIHGLSSVSVFIDLLLVRILLFCSILATISIVMICITVAIRFYTSLATPGWATVVTGIAICIFLQCVMFSGITVFTILASRQQISLAPIHFYKKFIAYISTLTERG